MSLEMLIWECTFPGCKRVISAYSQAGIDSVKNPHLKQHETDIKSIQEKIDSTPRNYDKLELSREDKAFLITRHIKVEE
jgi:hypothetical protein